MFVKKITSIASLIRKTTIIELKSGPKQSTYCRPYSKSFVSPIEPIFVQNMVSPLLSPSNGPTSSHLFPSLSLSDGLPNESALSDDSTKKLIPIVHQGDTWSNKMYELRDRPILVVHESKLMGGWIPYSARKWSIFVHSAEYFWSYSVSRMTFILT